MKKLFLSLLVVLCTFFFTSQTTFAAPKINKKEISIYEGNTYSLKVTGTSKKVTWSSSNKKVATVKNGKVSAVKKGTATITAKVDKKTYKCKVTVKSPKLNKTSLTLWYGDTYKLKLTGGSKITWKSSNTKVATVKNGVVTPKKAGTVTIKATYNKKTYSCKVTVKVDIDSVLMTIDNWIIGDIWNEGFCDINSYVLSGTNSIGESMNINKTISKLKTAMKKCDEFDSFISTLSNSKYKKVKLTWNKINSEINRLYKQVTIDTPRKNDRTYIFDYESFYELLFEFSDLIY